MQARREQVKELLRGSGVEEKDLELAADKIYELADIFFDLCLESKKQKQV